MTIQVAVDDFLVFACERKTKYATEQSARRAAQDRLRTGDAGTDRLWPYACANCRRWHLTKRENAGTLAVTASERWEGVPA